MPQRYPIFKRSASAFAREQLNEDPGDDMKMRSTRMSLHCVVWGSMGTTSQEIRARTSAWTGDYGLMTVDETVIASEIKPSKHEGGCGIDALQPPRTWSPLSGLSYHKPAQ